MWAEARPRAELNFLLTGNDVASLNFVREHLNRCDKLFCHGQVLHADHRIRSQAHCAYLGDEIAKDGELVFKPYACSPSPTAGQWQAGDPQQSPDKYLSHAIFDNAMRGETHIGVQILYADLLRLDLWDFIRMRSREGDFCVIEVARNPVAALAARELPNKGVLYLDADQVVAACDSSHTAQSRLRAAASDLASVDFRELLDSPEKIMQELAAFLVVKYSADVPSESLSWQSPRPRIANWLSLLHTVPNYVRDVMTGRNFAAFY